MGQAVRPFRVSVRIVVIQTVEDQIEVKAMKQRMTELESALAATVLENRMLQTTLEVASQALEMDLKKIREEIIAQATNSGQVSTQAAYDWFGISRQAYYQAQKRQWQREAEDHLLLELVQAL
jgi:hypothetical protein